MSKLPSFQFYPGDWLKDPELRRCSWQAKGAWIEALCLAFACEERGVFATNGEPWSAADLALAIGCAEEVVSELIDKGVAKIRVSDGAIYCRRMVNDEKLRQNRVKAGSKGGSKTQAKPKQTPKQTSSKGSSKTEAKGQAKTGSSSSSSSSDKKERKIEGAEEIFQGKKIPTEVWTADSDLAVRNYLRRWMTEALPGVEVAPVLAAVLAALNSGAQSRQEYVNRCLENGVKDLWLHRAMKLLRED